MSAAMAFDRPWVHHEGAEISFEAPADWEEVIEELLAPVGDAREMNLLFSRFSVRPNDTLERFAASTLAELSKNISSLEVLGSSEILVRGVRAMETRTRWKEHGRTFLQRHVAMAHRGAMYVVTATCLQHRAEELDRVLSHALATLRLLDWEQV